MEAKFADTALAQRVYRSVVQRVLSSGVCFLTKILDIVLIFQIDNYGLLLRYFAPRSYPDTCRRSAFRWSASVYWRKFHSSSRIAVSS
jgi:hypothetical protein